MSSDVSKDVERFYAINKHDRDKIIEAFDRADYKTLCNYAVFFNRDFNCTCENCKAEIALFYTKIFKLINE